ncbi:hypothetical protein BAE44_0026182 [Dichanthelium oligosanthes]|uniref:Protein ORANGE, chloroplastic n=1 Tax=Dichanthelium oligosanthes TaxID=888268 RepID=A0A1E5UJ06_9POAL|nr:hypothetical protein BAE44_0026182 [Dichanthelium oligosanthes]
MTCLAAPPAAPPAERVRLLVAAAAPSRARPRGLYCAVRGTAVAGDGAGCGRRQLVLRRCSTAGESRVAGDGGPSSFCIIEGPETIEDFVQMRSQEIQDNIKSRRNKIFLLMEEVRRLRVQQRIRTAESKGASSEENEMPEIPSTIPFMPDASPKTMKQLYMTSFSVISGIIIFGGLIAPVLELKLGLGGTSYEDFIRTLHLPLQLSQVDPIVASFSGGAVGVISALMLVEVRNVRQQEKKRCTYCHGTGTNNFLLNYLTQEWPQSFIMHDSSSIRPNASLYISETMFCLCVLWVARGAAHLSLTFHTSDRISLYVFQVMCPTCLCTGMAMASEHDPRIDPFD